MPKSLIVSPPSRPSPLHTPPTVFPALDLQSSREPWHIPQWPHPSPLPPRRKPKPIPRRRYPPASITSLNDVPPMFHSAPMPNTPPLCPRPPRDRKSKRNTDLSAWELEFQDTHSLLSVDANNLGAVEHINSALSDIKICSLNMNSLTDSKFISVLALIQFLKIDVVICTDTRHTTSSSHIFSQQTKLLF